MRLPAALLCCLVLASAPAWAAEKAHRSKSQPAPAPLQSLVVSVSAYNGVVEQTDGKPNIGAWGDRLDQLKPGFRAIAVSPDLLARGFKRKQRLRIEGFKGEFLILDRTPARWRNTIDVFLDQDVAKARRIGRKPRQIFWRGDALAPESEPKSTPPPSP